MLARRLDKSFFVVKLFVVFLRILACAAAQGCSNSLPSRL